MSVILEWTYAIVWGVPTLFLILGAGMYLSLRTGFAQLRLFPHALKVFVSRLFSGKRSKGISSFQALCTALAATVGTGNLAGVAGAIAIGGPGAVFWMWLCGILGMITKLAEAALSVHYRVKHGSDYFAGPMYMIRQGMSPRWHWLAGVYSFFGVVAAFGVGNATQVNAVISGVENCIVSMGGVPSRNLHLILGILLAVLVLMLLRGGAHQIGKAAEFLVPFAAVAYLLLGTLVLIIRADAIAGAMCSIVKGAFSPKAVTGGMIGSLILTLRVGISRGVFTNEAGMGTAGIAHGSADVEHPVEQGLMGIMEVFLDTIVICTMTALVILCSGVPIAYGVDTGIQLTMDGFAAILGPWTRVFITASVCLFAFATILGWGLYGVRCAQYLFGTKVWKLFALMQTATVILGALLKTGTVWLLAEIVNGLMAVPNLIALMALCPELFDLIKDYQKKTGSNAGGGILCRYPSTQTAANPRLCGNSTPLLLRRRKRGRKYIT